MLYAGSTLGDFFIIDVRSGEVVKQFKGHAAPINCFVEAKQREWIVTAGDDNQCNIF
jgi:bifunctional ADP-heptose synthase (sugar kinase/adenylyltransferase)